MNERDFCIWLKGFIDLEDPSRLSGLQFAKIKEQLDLVLISESQFFETRQFFNEGWLTRLGACKRWEISERTLTNWVQNGTVERKRKGRNSFYRKKRTDI